VRLNKARLVRVEPKSVRVQGSEWAAFFLHLVGTTDLQEGSISVGFREVPGYAESSPLPLTPAAEKQPFGDVEMQPESERPTPGPIGPRLPFRPMVVRDGILRYEDGREVALWGVNYYPEPANRPGILQKLGVKDAKGSVDDDFEDFARMGIDILRIHVFDSQFTDSQGNVIHNEHLDILDYLVAQCDKRGINLMLTPIAWWRFRDSTPDSFSANTPKNAMSMWPAMWPIQANYLRQFLTHKNPYTGRRLVDEPCLRLFEVINEPVYWSYSEIESGNVSGSRIPDDATNRGLAGVRGAFEKAAPEQWRNPATFAWFRYDTLRRYIDTMIDAMRSTGAKQPIAYSHCAVRDSDLVQALADSHCDAITLSAYPGGLNALQDDRNLLGGLASMKPLDPRLAAKARLVYEFDAAGMLRQAVMYPAMALHWRRLGVQVANQFQYDAKATVHVNWDWPTHYLNLWHTPEKMVSFLIGGEVFRRLPRGASFDLPPDNQVFAPGAVSFQRNTSLLAADDVYMQTNPTDWRPFSLPEKPRHVLSVGSSPYFDYEGNGVVDLTLDGSSATLRIYPDVERFPRTLPADGKVNERNVIMGTPEKPLTVLHDREHPFRLRLAGWAGAKIERIEGEKRIPVEARDGSFRARPGLYRLAR